MNNDAVLFHLKEALEQLQSTIQAIETDGEYESENFRVEMSHLYHHLNTAWNGRDISSERHDTCADEDFHRWRKFPDNSELYLAD